MRKTLRDEFCEALDYLKPDTDVDCLFVLRHKDREQWLERLARGQSIMKQLGTRTMFTSWDDNTYEEAKRAVILASTLRVKRLGIVTHQYHHYRAYLTFAQVFKNTGIEIVSLPIKQREMYLEEEFSKIDNYIMWGHCMPYEEALICLQQQIALPS